MTVETQNQPCTEKTSCSSNRMPVYIPAVDIYEKEDAVLIRCDMPGVSNQRLDVTVEKGVLSIVGEQKTQNPEGYTCLSREYGKGRFKRSFRLSDGIDVEKVSARIKDGVLDVELPRSEKEQARKIAVKVA